MSTNANFWMQENLPYPPLQNTDLNNRQESALNGEFADLPFSPVYTSSIPTSFFRYLPQQEDGDSVLLNNQQPDNRLKDYFGEKEEKLPVKS